MKTKIMTVILGAVLVFATHAVYAENVTISTYYPSPYGSYQTLEVTGSTYLATASGNVGVGTNTPEAWAKLDVHVGANEGLHVFRSGTGGVLLGYNGSTIFGRTAADANGELRLNPLGGNVGVNMNSAPAYALDVAGTTETDVLRVTGDVFLVTNTAGQAGELQVDCTASGCYALAVYS
jgi:hypothetical protein